MTDKPFLANRSPESKQRYRFRLFLVAAASCMVVVAQMYVFTVLGLMEEEGFTYSIGALLACFILFAVLFLTGLNTKARDPSLTSGMMSCSMLGLAVAMFFSSSDARGLLLMIFLVSFIFGVLRLQTRELFYSALIASLIYAGVVSLLLQFRPEVVDLRLELLRWVVMSCVLGWFSVIGGHIGRVRKQISDRNAELRKALQTIQDLATHDVLTGLHNRRYLEDAMRHEKSQSERSIRPFCLCIVDLDLFKSINDTYGHNAGDEALKGFSANVLTILRKSDHFGRYGGEEFLGILTNTDLAGAKVWAENLRHRTECLEFPGLPTGFSITVSIGIAQHQPGEDVDKTVSRADRALYRAKSEGRNRIVALEAA